jgi:poly(3-hydroxybutyrate) depolymerase
MLENSSLYQWHEYCKMSMVPYRMMVKMNKTMHENPYSPLLDSKYGRTVSASLEIVERLTRSYSKPEFGIKDTDINGEKINIIQENVLYKPFCTLIHFKKAKKIKLPKLLIVAPMSGHHSTLLRNTVEGALPFFDVYITDWIDAKLVPVSSGSFNLDDYIDYCIEFMELLAPNLHVLAVCQPAVPVLAAVSIMSSEGNKHVPDSMILMGGPIDTRKSPTKVDTFAVQKSLNWFEENLVTRVPYSYPGYCRAVYPGFLQLSGFVMMNVQRHIDAHVKLFNTIVEDKFDKAEAQRKFYDEYFSVMDIPAEFYIQTVRLVFKDHDLPLGKMVSRGRKVDPSKITHTALLGVEGENDDITGIGQTKAALTLCKNIAEDKKQYYLQKDVGHYGVFSGRRYREQIIPVINEFVKKISKNKTIQ